MHIKETLSVVNGVIEQPPLIQIKTDKGLMSACNKACHDIHRLLSAPKVKGISRRVSIVLDGVETNVKFGDNCPAMEVDQEFVRLAAAKGANGKGKFKIDAKVWASDYTLFSEVLFPTLSASLRYFLTPYISKEVKGDEYVATGKKVFKVDVKRREDGIAFLTQSTSLIEKAIYLTKDALEAPKEENEDEHLRNKRASSQKAIDLKREAKAIAGKK